MGSHSLLWSLTSPGQQESWLFGTMHIRDERAHQLSHDLYSLILAADSFIGEMDLNPVHPGIEHKLYDVRSFISSKAFQKLHGQLLKSFDIDLAMYQRLHPLMILSVISASVLQKEHLISLDEHLWNFARLHDKPTGGLESYEEQFRILHSIDPGPLYKHLQHIGRNPSEVRKHTARGLNLYMQGRIHELYILSKSSMHDLRKKIIYERNKRMADVIIGLDHSLKYFITVGAGHLSGKTGIISSLKKVGWKVKPVMSDL